MRKNLKIFVFGTFRDVSDDKKKSIISACNDLGKVIAELGHTLIAISSRDDVVDIHVINGMNNVQKKSNVIICRSNSTLHQFDRLRLNNIRFRYRRNKGNLTNTHIYAINLCDVVVTLGGNHKLDPQIGYTSIALEKPLLSIPSFGFSSKEIFSVVLEQYYRIPCKLTEEEISKIAEEWQEDTAFVCIKALEKIYKNHPFRNSNFAPQMTLSIISIFLIFAWIGIFLNPGFLSNNEIALFVLLGIASSIGTATRNLTRIITDEYVDFGFQYLWTEFVTGLLIAFCFILAYFTIGYIFLGDFVSVQDMKDFKRISITMSILSISITFLIEKAIKSLSFRLSKSLNEIS